MKKFLIHKNSIIIKLTGFMLLLIILQSVFLWGSIIASGVISGLEDNAYSLLSTTIENRKNYIQNEMHNRWSNFDSYSQEIVDIYQEQVGEADKLTSQQADEFLNKATPELISLLRSTMTTGCFLILGDNKLDTSAHSCVYLKDYNPSANVEHNSDLQLLKGPVSVSREENIPLDKSWSYGLTLSAENEDIFYKPYNESLASKDAKYLGYWTVSPSIAGSAYVLTHSKPLVDDNGRTIGVIGVEIDQPYLYKMLPAAELSAEGDLGYVIARYDESTGDITPAMVNGTLQKAVVSTNYPIQYELINDASDAFVISNAGIEFPVVFHPSTLEMYNSNTPFANEQWLLLGLARKDDVTGFADNVSITMLTALLLSLAVGAILAYCISASFTKPITQLAKDVRNNNPRDVISLARTGLSEIDDLSYAVEYLNKSVVDSVLKTDKIISMVNLELGAFEYKAGGGYVTGTPLVFSVLGFEPKAYNDCAMAKDVFFSKIRAISQRVEDEVNNIFMLSKTPPKWVKITMVENDLGVQGVVMDVTKEILDKHALNFERDYDPLTKIYNRFAFHREVGNIFNEGNLKTAAFAMFDLDNLKYVNDTYGHDTGDAYIKGASALIAKLPKSNCVVGRMSGDEFYVFFYGYDSTEEVNEQIDELFDDFENNFIVLPNGNTFKIRASGGISWYAKDSRNLEELIHYADFAMYEGKHTVKGEMRQFDKETYNNGAFMLSGNEELNKVLDNQLVQFAFQPIVYARTGELYGYESLMRPQSEVLNTPLKLIQLASSQAQLWKVEKITFFKTLSTCMRHLDLMGDKKIFLNSVPNQVLKESEYAEIERLYSKILPNVVIEIIESEKLDEFSLTFKQELAKSWNAMIALDDYGTGYNSDVSLLNISPDIVKIDRMMIEGIETDKNRQAIVRKLITYSKERGILVLAEGVETLEQMKYLILLGVDLLQGYYIARPSFDPAFDEQALKEQIKSIL